MMDELVSGAPDKGRDVSHELAEEDFA